MSGEITSGKNVAPSLSFKVNTKLTSRKVATTSSKLAGSFKDSAGTANDEDKDYILEADGNSLKSSGITSFPLYFVGRGQKLKQENFKPLKLVKIEREQDRKGANLGIFLLTCMSV